MLEKKLDELNKELFKTKEENEQLTLARADLENEKVSMFFYKSLIIVISLVILYTDLFL